MKTRKRQTAKIVACLLIVLALDLVCVKAANAQLGRIPEASKYALKVRTASVGSKWDGPLSTYTGGSYLSGHINALWPSAPRGKRRQIVLGAALHHHVPFRLLLGIWGAESGFGRYACHFGLTGFYRSGTSGNFRKDAHIAADLLDRLYRSRYKRRAI